MRCLKNILGVRLLLLVGALVLGVAMPQAALAKKRVTTKLASASCGTLIPASQTVRPLGKLFVSGVACAKGRVKIQQERAGSWVGLARTRAPLSGNYSTCVTLRDAGGSTSVPLRAVASNGSMAFATVQISTQGTDSCSSTPPPPPASYTLAVSVAGSGSVSGSGISCPGTCSASYDSGSSVTLTETPASGYTFSGWGGACSGVSTTCTISMTEAKSVSASFTANPPPPPSPTSCTGGFYAGLELGNLLEFLQASTTSNASLSATLSEHFAGLWGARASFNGGSGNAYARGIFEPDWQPGETVCYSAAFKLPVGFYSAQQGQVDLMRWDNFPILGTVDDYGGIVINSDHVARLIRGRNTIEQVPLGSFALSEGTWHQIVVVQTLSTSAPYSSVQLDGATVISTNAQNSYGRAIDRIRYGLVAIDAGTQTNPLTVYFDEAAAK